MLLHKDESTLSEVLKLEREKGIKYFQFIIGMIIAAIAFNVFILPCNVVYGVSGVGVILKHTFNINPAITVFIGDVILLLISFLVLGVKKTKGSIIGSLIYPLFIQMASWIPQYVNISMKEPLLLILFGATLSGLGYGLIFKSGYTTGGTDVLNQIVAKYGHTSMGNAMLFTDGLIIFISIFVFGFSKAMYSIVNLYIVGLITDKMMIGISSSKAFYIITTEEHKIKHFIMDEMGHGVTLLEGNGAFSGNKQKVLMCVIPTREYVIVKEGIHLIDKNAFFVVADAYEVYGSK